MKKKLFPLLGGIVLLAALLGIYAYSSSSSGENGDGTEPTTEQTSDTSLVNTGEYTLCDREAESLRDVAINSGDNTLSLKYSEDGYTVEGYENVDINMSNTASLASIFIGLYSDNKIEGAENEPEKYGLDNPLAVGTATYDDGSSVTLKLGSLTADKQYYYLESSDAEGVYLVDAVVGARMLYTINNLVDKNIASIKPNYVTYIEVLRNNESELLLYYDEENSNANTNLAQYGLATLTMERPLEGASVYPYNLESSILSTCSSITLDDVVDAQPTDYARYGLDVPRLTVRLRDNSGSLEIKAGSDAGEGNVYVMVNDSVSVFTMDASLLEPFDNYTITDFIEKFVALHSRSDVSRVDMVSEFGTVNLEFREDGENTITTDENGAVQDNRLAILNGKTVEGDDFADFYELLVGLSFDQIGEHTQKSGEPAVTLTYTLLDGTVETTEFYTFNDNFYSVGKDGEYDMLVSKQSVKQIVDRAAALSQ